MKKGVLAEISLGWLEWEKHYKQGSERNLFQNSKYSADYSQTAIKNILQVIIDHFHTWAYSITQLTALDWKSFENDCFLSTCIRKYLSGIGSVSVCVCVCVCV